MSLSQMKKMEEMEEESEAIISMVEDVDSDENTCIYPEDGHETTVATDDFKLICSESLSSEDDTAETLEDMAIDLGEETRETLQYLETMSPQQFEDEFSAKRVNYLLKPLESGERTIKYLLKQHEKREYTAEMLKAERKPIKTTLTAALQMKHNWIEFHSEQMFKCHYAGNLGIFRCEKCYFCIDCFPCKEKREYSLPEKWCPYCSKRFSNIGSYTYFNNVACTHYCTKNYIIKE